MLTRELPKVNPKYTGRKWLNNTWLNFPWSQDPSPTQIHVFILPFASEAGHDCPPWPRDTGSEPVPAPHYKRLSPKTADSSKWGGPVHRCKQTGWLQGPVSVRTHNIYYHGADRVMTVQKVTEATDNHECDQRIYLNTSYGKTSLAISNVHILTGNFGLAIKSFKGSYLLKGTF